MIQTLDLRGIQPTRAQLLTLIPRPALDVSVASEAAARLIDEVRNEGEAALHRHAEQFDGVTDAPIRVAPETIAAAVAALEPAVREAIEEAIERVRTATRAQVPAPITTTLAPARRSCSAGSRSPGRPVRARRQGRLSVERRHERRPRAGRRGGVGRPRVAAAARVRRPRAPDDPRRGRAARRRRGLCDGRRRRDRRVRLRGRRTSDLDPVRRRHRSRQHLRRGGQAARARASWASTPRPAPPRSS